MTTPPRCMMLCLTAVLCLATTACTSVRQVHPRKSRYVLEVRVPSADTPVGSPTILVRPLRSAEQSASRLFTYRTANGKWHSDYYNEFFAAPAALATVQTQRALAGAGLFSHTLLVGSRTPTDFVLDGYLSAIYGDAARNRGIVEVQYELMDCRGAKPQILWSRTYRKESEAKEFAPPELVKAWNAALGEVLADLVRDLRGKMSP